MLTITRQPGDALSTPSDLSAVLQAGRRAPSADNSQPWALRARGSSIELAFDPARARSGHIGNLAAQMTLGAILESMDLVARASSDLAGAIDARATNRAPFDPAPLAADVLDAIASEGSADASVFLTNDPCRREIVASAAAAADRVRFAATPLEDLHRWLRFSPEDAEATKDGLDVRLLALGRSERVGLRMCGSAAGASVVRALGGAAMAGRRARAEVLAAGGLGLVTQPALGDADFVASGRVMLRAWLRATQLGLGFAPICAAVFLPLSRHFGAVFERKHDDALAAAERGLREAFAVPETHHPVFLFRLGIPTDVPRVRSERREIAQ